VYVSLLLTWVGSVTHSVSTTMTDEKGFHFTHDHWIFPLVGFLSTGLFVAIMYYLYNKEFNEVMSILRESQTA